MKKSEESVSSAKDANPAPPISLESERRKAMMLIHGVEKDTANFREKFYRRPKNHFDLPAMDLIRYVINKDEARRSPKTYKDFGALLQRGVREEVSLLYPGELLHIETALERAAQFDQLVTSARQRLTAAFQDHIGKYCHSFSAEAEECEIPCIQEYENNIIRWRSVIRDCLVLLDDIVRSIAEVGPTFESYVANYDKVLHYMHLTLEVFPRVYNPLKDWVTSDEAYARKLQDEANDLLRKRVAVTENLRRQMMRADDMKSKVSRTNHTTKTLRGRLNRSLEERKFCRRQELVLTENAAKMETEIAQTKSELETCLSEYYNRTYNSEALQKRLMTKAATHQEELDKMQKRLEALKVNLSRVRKQRYIIQKECHKLQAMHERSNKAVGLASEDAEERTRDFQELQSESRQLSEKLIVLRRIRAIKLSPETVKKIFTDGYVPGRKLSVIDAFDEALRVTAADIGKDWAFLYSKLPFTPERDMITRTHDIQAIDVSSQKKDVGLQGAAIRSLEKWKRLSQEASVNALVRTLRTIKKPGVANRIEKHINDVMS